MLLNYKETSIPYVLVDIEGNLYKESREVSQTSIKGTRYSKTIQGGSFKGVDNGLGYLQVKVTVDGFTYTRYLHNLVWEAFNGRIPEGFEINHINHIKADCSLDNLELVTHKENMQKMADFYGSSKTTTQGILSQLDNISEDKTNCDFMNDLLWSVQLKGWKSTANMLGYSDNGLRKIFERLTGSPPTVVRKSSKVKEYKTDNPSNFLPKLTEKDKDYILNHYIPKCKEFGCRALARKLGVSHSVVSRLLKGDKSIIS